MKNLISFFLFFLPRLYYSAVTHVASARNSLADAILTDIGNNGQLTLRTVADGEIATLTLPTTSGTVSGADLTFGTFTDDTNAAGGTVDHLRIETSGGVEVFRFPVADITISNTVIGAGDTVQCSSLVYTASA